MTQPREGDVLLTSRIYTGLGDLFDSGYHVSRAIQRFTDSPWNHVAGFLRIHDTLVIVEAQWDAVKIRPLDFYDDPKYRTKLVSFPGDDDRRSDVTRFWASQLFDSYDKGLIKKMARSILRNGIEGLAELRQELENDDFWICSEYMWEGWEAGGLLSRLDRIWIPDDFAHLDRSLVS